MTVKDHLTGSYLNVIIKGGVFHMDASVRVVPLLEVYALIFLILTLRKMRKK